MSLASALLNGGGALDLSPDEFFVGSETWRGNEAAPTNVRVSRVLLSYGDANPTFHYKNQLMVTLQVHYRDRNVEFMSALNARDQRRLIEKYQLSIATRIGGGSRAKLHTVTVNIKKRPRVAVWLDQAMMAGVLSASAQLGGLSAKKPIPASAVDYALHKLGPKVQRCGITKAALREGMKVELEHRDVTKGAIEKTARIAAAHICERKDYYKRLKKYVEK